MTSIAINAPDAPPPVGGYSQAVEVRDAKRLLYISGQVPESDTGVVPADFGAQARLAWSHLLAQLAAAELTVNNLVKVTTFLASREFADRNAEVRREVLGQHAPALTVIIAGIYDARWLLEIEAIAAE
jgi:enamine deaminase RidA (YjgF/YER057c/UK114 family)